LPRSHGEAAAALFVVYLEAAVVRFDRALSDAAVPVAYGAIGRRGAQRVVEQVAHDATELAGRCRDVSNRRFDSTVDAHMNVSREHSSH
jgi:hypothetical protein